MPVKPVAKSHTSLPHHLHVATREYTVSSSDRKPAKLRVAMQNGGCIFEKQTGMQYFKQFT